MPVSIHDIVSFSTRRQVPPATRAAAIPAILDTLAVLFAGSAEPAVATLGATFLALPGDAGRPAFAGGGSLRPEDTALLYGMAAHALDYDDVSMLAICHPSAPVLAALLACRPWDGIDGAQLCEAHAIGAEVMIRMGQAIGFRHFEIGYHATATMGHFGAVAAIARLRALPDDVVANSFAIVASMTAGLRLNFGTPVKPLHAGLAASNALRAVSWASAGIHASRGELLGPGGIFEALTGGATPGWSDDVPLGAPFAIETPGLERKRYACCYMLHKVIALGLEVAAAGLALDDIGTLTVTMPRGGLRPLSHPIPHCGNEALFSLPYTLLAAIADGDISFDSFTDAAVARPAIRRRLGDVTALEEGAAPLTAEQIGAAPVTLSLGMRDGTVRTFSRTVAPGSAADPLTTADLRAKWTQCLRRAAPALSAERAGALFDGGHAALQSGPIGPWLHSVWESLYPARPLEGQGAS